MKSQSKVLNRKDYQQLATLIAGESSEGGNRLIDGFHCEFFPETNTNTQTTKRTTKHKIDSYLRLLLMKLMPYVLIAEIPQPPMSKSYWEYSQLYFDAQRQFNNLLENGTYPEKIAKRNELEKRLEYLRAKHNNSFDDFKFFVPRAEYELRNLESNKVRDEMPDIELYDEDERWKKDQINQYNTIDDFKPIPGIDYEVKKFKDKLNHKAIKRLIDSNILHLA